MSMRKRIAIGAVFVIGVATYLLSQPRQGTVEWHRGRYAALLTEDTWTEHLGQIWRKLRGKRAVIRRPSEGDSRNWSCTRRRWFNLDISKNAGSLSSMDERKE